MATEPTKIGPFVNGMNNRREDYELANLDAKDAVQEVRQAVNVDFSAQGRVRLRPGFTLSQAATAGRALWANRDGSRAFFADGQTLYEFDGTNKTAVRTDLPANCRPAFEDTARGIFYSDGSQIRHISDADRPAHPPAMAAPTGPLRCLYTYTMADGSESAASAPSEGQAYLGTAVVTGLPPAFPPGAVAMNVYADDGSSEFFHCTTLTAAATTAVVDTNASGAVCRTRERAPLPAGTILRQSNGRLFSARGKFLFRSDAFNFLVYDPSTGFFALPHPIVIVRGTSEGLFVVTTAATYWLPADGASLNQIAPFGGVPGTDGLSPDGKLVWWWAQDQGLVKGAAGTIELPVSERVDPGTAGFGASFWRRQQGQSHVVTSLFNTAPGAAASSFMEAEVIRKGQTA